MPVYTAPSSSCITITIIRGVSAWIGGLSRDQTRPCVHDLLMAYVQGYVRRDSGKTEEAFPEDFDI